MKTSKISKYQSGMSIIDGWLDYQRIQHRLPSITVGIVHKQRPIFMKSYGFADMEKRVVAQIKTSYRIASISKLFTAVAIMQLYQDRKISLDDRVETYLPWFRSKKDKRLKNITIRQLLNHSSGLQRDGYTGHWESEKFPTVVQIKQQIQKGVSVYAPNERWKYSNVGYTILGLIVEKIAGESYENYITKKIFKPLGLRQTGVEIETSKPTSLAVGYSRAIDDIGRRPFLHLSTGAMKAATGFYSTAGDLCYFISAQGISNKKLLDPELKKEMQRVQWYDEDEDVQWGLGFERWKVGRSTILGHNGGFHGFSAQVGFDAKHELGVVVLINSIDGHAFSITNGVFHLLSYVREHGPAKITNQKKLKKYEGRFYSIWDDFDIRVFGDKLAMVYVGMSKPMQSFFYLSPDGKDCFKKVVPGSSRSAGEKVKFEFDTKGKVKMLRIGPSSFYPFEIVRKRKKK